MLSGVLDQITKIRDNRTLLVGVLPTLVLGIVSVAVFTHATGSGQDLLDWWDAQSGTVQGLLVVGTAAASFLIASIVLANAPRLVYILEGYPFKTSLLGRYGMWVHLRRRAKATSLYPNYIGSTLLPTSLGNVLVTGENHALDAYGIAPISAWSRLYAVVDQADRDAIDAARTALDFLAVVCTYASLFTVASMVFLAVHGAAGTLYLLAVGGGALAAYASYAGAVRAGLSLAAQVAAAFDQSRHALLQKLRLPLPATPAEERRLWGEVDALIRSHSPSEAWVYQDPVEK